MDGAQVKVSVQDLRNTLQDDAALKVLVEKQLAELAAFSDLELAFLLPLAPDIVDKIREQTKRFSQARANPYPPASVNNLSVQVTLPTKGRVGVTEWNSKIEV